MPWDCMIPGQAKPETACPENLTCKYKEQTTVSHMQTMT